MTHRGSEMNDIFYPEDEKIKTRSNNSGGIQGGISNGNDIFFRVAFKPVATLLQKQETIDKDGNPTTFKASGRHDACVLPRAVPIVESMAAMVIFRPIFVYKTQIIIFNYSDKKTAIIVLAFKYFAVYLQSTSGCL